MKTAGQYMLVLMLFPAFLYAQKGSKVKCLYKDAAEFINDSPSFDFECKSKNKILLNDFFIKNYVTVKESDSTYKFPKSSLYGFQTCNGQMYRFLNKKELLLLSDNEEVLIYRHQVAKPPAGRTNVTNYYFSVGKNGRLLKLTFKNLKESFAYNTVFLSFIESEFKYNTDLAGYDERLKKYRVNVLLQKSKIK